MRSTRSRLRGWPTDPATAPPHRPHPAHRPRRHPALRGPGRDRQRQPYWAFEDEPSRDLTRPVVGDERTDRMYPFASLLRAGARMAMGSDWNVTTADPLRLLEVADAARRSGRPRRRAVRSRPRRSPSRKDCGRSRQGRPTWHGWTRRPPPSRSAALPTWSCWTGTSWRPMPGLPADARVLLTLVDGEPCTRAMTSCGELGALASLFVALALLAARDERRCGLAAPPGYAESPLPPTR